MRLESFRLETNRSTCSHCNRTSDPGELVFHDVTNSSRLFCRPACAEKAAAGPVWKRS